MENFLYYMDLPMEFFNTLVYNNPVWSAIGICIFVFIVSEVLFLKFYEVKEDDDPLLFNVIEGKFICLFGAMAIFLISCMVITLITWTTLIGSLLALYFGSNYLYVKRKLKKQKILKMNLKKGVKKRRKEDGR